jgi:hypothetical protein
VGGAQSVSKLHPQTATLDVAHVTMIEGPVDTSGGQQLTQRFTDLVNAVRSLAPETLILDGEVAIFDEHLISRFEWMRHGKPDEKKPSARQTAPHPALSPEGRGKDRRLVHRRAASQVGDGPGYRARAIRGDEARDVGDFGECRIPLEQGAGARGRSRGSATWPA